MTFDYNVYPFLSVDELNKKMTGSNQLGVFLVFDKESATYKELLNKVMAAVGIDLSSALCLELERNSCVPFSFYKQHNIHTIIVFEISPSHLSINTVLNKYQPQKIEGIQILFSDSLATISEQTELKRPLWTALKSLFNV